MQSDCAFESRRRVAGNDDRPGRRILLFEAVGQGQADPIPDEGIRGGAADRPLRVLVQDRGTGGAEDLHGLHRSIRGNPEAKLHPTLDPLAASRVGIDPVPLDLTVDVPQKVGTPVSPPTSRGQPSSTASHRSETALSQCSHPASPGAPATGADTLVGRADSRSSRPAAVAPWHQEQPVSRRFPLGRLRRWIHVGH